MTWHPIETLENSDGETLLLARFREGAALPDYVVSATFGVAMPGYTDCASYSGWFVDGVPLDDPPRYRGTRISSGILSKDHGFAPTHWTYIPK